MMRIPLTKYPLMLAICSVSLLSHSCAPAPPEAPQTRQNLQDLAPNPTLCQEEPRAPRPNVAQPNTSDAKTYTLEPARWNISTNGQNALATTDGFNEAITWAKSQGYTTFVTPPGKYLVGVEATINYTRGVQLEGGMTFEFQPGALLQMASNTKWNYCVLAVTGKDDVVIRGGELRGDKDTHTYVPRKDGKTAHDEGHGICVQNESKRVLIEGMEIHNMTGDGVLIVGGGGEGSSCEDITIRGSHLHHNRRQGVSIVGGKRVLIEDNEIDHIVGTSPQFGVDIESLKYISRDIVIQRNQFHHNAGGDFVNTDGNNVWFEENVCDQTGLTKPQTDGPIVHWEETDQVIRKNKITITTGSSNGKWGIIGYVRKDQKRDLRIPNLIEDNELFGGGIHVAKTNLMTLRGNTIHKSLMLAVNSTCLRLEGNDIVRPSGFNREDFKLKRVSGTAQGNTINGDYPFDIPMSDDMNFTNSPPHLW